MTSLAELSDRHARAVSGVGSGGDALVVRIVAPSLASLTDQHLLTCLTNLLCRMAGSVSAIELNVPETKMTVVMPHGGRGELAFDAMVALARWAVGDHVPVMRATAADERLTICLGASCGVAADLYAYGQGWIAWVGSSAPRARPLSKDANPVGPYFAACLAAGEVFKRARGLVRGRFAIDDGYSLWDGITGPLAQLNDGPPLTDHVLPPFYLVGAGAVGQGLTAIIAASLMPAFVATIDDDIHDGTNLNRCFVAGTTDVGQPKVDAITRVRRMTGLSGAEFKGTLQQLVRHGPLGPMPDAMRDAQDKDSFDIIVSAVDRNTSRWDIQGLQPRLAIGGSTDGLTAKAMAFGMLEGDPCLACNNPREEDGAKLRQIEQTIRGLAPDDAREDLKKRGLTHDEIEAVMVFIRDAPGCGTAGERILGALAASSPREFSVSFVSMAAAILTFARLLTTTFCNEPVPARPMMTSISFRNLSMADDAIAQDSTCPFCSKRRVAAPI